MRNEILNWKPALFLYSVKMYEYGKLRNAWVLDKIEYVDIITSVLSAYFNRHRITHNIITNEKFKNNSVHIVIVYELKLFNITQPIKFVSKEYTIHEINNKIKQINTIIQTYIETKNLESLILALGENPKYDSNEIYHIIKCYVCKFFNNKKIIKLPSSSIYDYCIN